MGRQAREYLQYVSCTSKKGAWDQPEAAEAAAQRIATRTGDATWTAYKCRYCTSHHVGRTRPKGQRHRPGHRPALRSEPFISQSASYGED